MTTKQEIENIKDRIFFNKMNSRLNLQLQRNLEHELKTLQAQLEDIEKEA